jgi:hypothetical protein
MDEQDRDDKSLFSKIGLNACFRGKTMETLDITA